MNDQTSRLSLPPTQYISFVIRLTQCMWIILLLPDAPRPDHKILS